MTKEIKMFNNCQTKILNWMKVKTCKPNKISRPNKHRDIKIIVKLN